MRTLGAIKWVANPVAWTSFVRGTVKALCVAAIAVLAGCGGEWWDDHKPAQPSLTPAAIDFGATLIGTTRTERAWLGNAVSLFQVIAPLEDVRVGIDGAGLRFESDCPTVLASGAVCPIMIVFEPVVAGPVSGRLTVTSKAYGPPLTVVIKATAVSTLDPPQAAFAWAAGASPDFGESAVGATVTRNFVLNNLGNAAGLVTLRLGADDVWQLVDGCVGEIAAGASCGASVSFTPRNAGSSQAWLIFSDAYHGFADSPALGLRGSGR